MAQSNQITAGYKLIDRYQLSQPFATDLAGAEAWHAVDFALDRPVSVLLLGGPYAENGAEAARRTALLTDNRITKIIDVGELHQGEQTRHYIVTEPIAGATLEEVVSELPLDSASTRTIIGEIASALDEADQRGLHHVALRPGAVRINNGRVYLTGLGVDAELGAVNPELGNGEHQDAVGLAALTYYALTGYWPLPTPDGAWRRPGAPALPLAPRDENGLVRPLRDMVPGADPVLLELADRAFGENAAPLRAPHTVASHLSPWLPLASLPVTPDAVTPTHPLTAPTPVVSAPGRKSVKPGAQPGRPATGRIPKAVKRTIAVIPEDEPLHIRSFPDPDAPFASAPQRLAPVYQPPKPPRPRGVRATPIVLGLTLAAVGGSAAWAAHNVISPFVDPPITHNIIEPDPPIYTAAPGFEEEVAAPEPVEIHPIVVSGISVDPYGDGERAENAYAAVDGDPSTFWYTYTYATTNFGGLKPGVGYFIQLEGPAPVSSITLYANGGGGQVQIRKTTAEDPAGGDLLGTTEFGVETTVNFGGEIELDSIMLWITELPQLPDGRFRLELREVIVR